MKRPFFLLLLSMGAGLSLPEPVMAQPPGQGKGQGVVRCLVRDAAGNLRTVHVRRSDRRILHPQVIRKVERAGGGVEYRPALSSAYRPGPGWGYGYGRSYGYYSVPGRRWYPVRPGYQGTYRPSTNYGVDAVLYQGPRGKYGIPGYGRPGGAFPRPVVRPQLPGLPLPRYSGNVKGSGR